MTPPVWSRVALVAVVVCMCVSVCVHAKPTIYVKNEQDKLEPVLVPVSSTVIPLPVYKVGYGVVGVQGPKGPRPAGDLKLITASKKKATFKEDEFPIKIKQNKRLEDEEKDFL